LEPGFSVAMVPQPSCGRSKNGFGALPWCPGSHTALLLSEARAPSLPCFPRAASGRQAGLHRRSPCHRVSQPGTWRANRALSILTMIPHDTLRFFFVLWSRNVQGGIHISKHLVFVKLREHIFFFFFFFQEGKVRFVEQVFTISGK